MVSDAVTTMARRAGIEVPKDLSGNIVPRLMHAAEGQFGTAMDIAATAIERALAPKGEKGNRLPPAKSLEIDHFARTYQLRTGAPSFADPFTSADWRKIAVHRVLGLGAPKYENDGK